MYLIIASHILAVLLFTPFTAIGITVYCWRRRNEEPSTVALERNYLVKMVRYVLLVFQYCLVPIYVPVSAMIATEERTSLAATLSVVSLALIVLLYFVI